MRVAIQISTGKLIEAQSGGEDESSLESLKMNAVAAGFPEADVEVKLVTFSEFSTLLENQQNVEKTYGDKRRAEYPPFSDYLDGIVKGDTAQVQAYIDACKAVKAKYPK